MIHWLDTLNELKNPREDQYDDGCLLKRDDWPTDFQLFLDTINGCDFEEEQALEVSIPIPWNASPSIRNTLSTIYGQKNGCDQTLRGWLTVTDISFPMDVIPIAKFADSSLVAISMRKKDYGSVYYWDWYHDYPWRGDFFQLRLEKVAEKFPMYDEILDDESHPQYQDISDAANEAFMIKLADSFEEFVSMIQVDDTA